MFEAQGSWPSQVRSGYGRFVGVADNAGPHMTFLILTDDTMQAIPRSNVVSRTFAPGPELPAFSLETGGELSNATSDENVNDNDDNDDNDEATVTANNYSSVPARFFTQQEANDILQDQVSKKKKCPLFSPTELIGRTFIREREDGQRLRAQICEYIETRDNELHDTTKGFLVQVGDEAAVTSTK